MSIEGYRQIYQSCTYSKLCKLFLPIIQLHKPVLKDRLIVQTKISQTFHARTTPNKNPTLYTITRLLLLWMKVLNLHPGISLNPALCSTVLPFTARSSFQHQQNNISHESAGSTQLFIFLPKNDLWLFLACDFKAHWNNGLCSA